MSIDWNKRSPTTRGTRVKRRAPALPAGYDTVSIGAHPTGTWDKGGTEFRLTVEYNHLALRIPLETLYEYQGHLYVVKELSNKLTMTSQSTTVTLVRVDPP